MLSDRNRALLERMCRGRERWFPDDDVLNRLLDAARDEAQADNDLLQGAPRPFAEVSDEYEEDMDGGRIGDAFPGSGVLYGHDLPNLGHFRKARAALSKAES